MAVSTSPEEDLEQELEEEEESTNLIQTTTTTRLSSSSSSSLRRRLPPPSSNNNNTTVDDTVRDFATTDSSSGITTTNSDEEINRIIQEDNHHHHHHHHHQKVKSNPPPLTNGEEETTTSGGGGGGGGERIGGHGEEEKEANFAFKYAYRPSAPAHRRIKESPLSSDAIFRQSHAGLLNLCIVVLVAVNSRLIIENLMKYGFLMGSGFWFSSHSLRDWPLFMCCLTLPIFPLGAFMVEKLAQNKLVSEPVVVSLHVIISSSAIFYPVFMILRFESAVASGIALMLFACIVWLKLVSYAHANYDIRALTKSVEKGQVLSDSPDMDNSYSVNIKKLTYFMVAPTLCYQPSYPRTTCIRKGWVIRQFIKLVIFTGLMGFIIEQYINPIVQNSQHPLKGDLLNGVERVLKLSVPVLYVWLCMFYCFFHLWLNILAELLRFGDREFYKDWWNAKTVEEYWRMWNMPVHKWMVRHIYFPCLRNGLPKGAAVLISFFISAIFHELCIAVPCHIFKFWAFMGIMLQIPLVLLTNYLQNKFRNTMVGNMIFWFCFSIFGQPMSILLYYHDLMNRRARTE